jgi:hypothetical protein
VIPTGGGVISECGCEFGVETTQMYSFSTIRNLSNPFLTSIVKIDAYKSGRGVLSFSIVAAILRMSSEAKIVPAIVEGVVVPVVNEKTFGRVHNLPVESDGFSFARANIDETGRIELLAASVDAPFEISEAVVNIVINDSPISFAEVNPAEFVTIFVPAIGRNRPGAEPIQPLRYCYCKFCRHNTLSSLQKFEYRNPKS